MSDLVERLRAVAEHIELAEYPCRDVALGRSKLVHAAADRITALESELAERTRERDELAAKVYVPGQWKCAKCNFRLTQSNLYMVASGTIGSRDEPGDKCPNCNGPLWRVSAMEDRTEAYRTANEQFDRAESALADAKRLREALERLKEEGISRYAATTHTPIEEAIGFLTAQFHGADAFVRNIATAALAGSAVCAPTRRINDVADFARAYAAEKVEEEREACARVADQVWAQNIASAIRARQGREPK